MFRIFRTALTLLVMAGGALWVVPSHAAEEGATGSEPTMLRFMIVRTFPAGALEGLDEQAKQEVNSKNTASGVRWIRSYANADLTKTFCIYEGPSEEAIRQAADANDIPVDYVVEIPVDLMP